MKKIIAIDFDGTLVEDNYPNIRKSKYAVDKLDKTK